MATIHDSIHEQYEECGKVFMSKLSYYKIALSTVLASLSLIVVIVIAVVAASYQPVKDIAVLKNQSINMDKKLDQLIRESTPIKSQITTMPETGLVNNTEGK